MQRLVGSRPKPAHAVVDGLQVGLAAAAFKSGRGCAQQAMPARAVLEDPDGNAVADGLE